MKPVIGISCARNDQGASFLRSEYALAVSRSGGIPYLLPQLPEEHVNDQLSILDGIIFSGGNDYNAGLYNQARHHSVNPMDEYREQHDLKLFALSRQRRLPMLCICAGAQLAAIHFGASIIQDIQDYCPRAHQHIRSFYAHAHVLELDSQSHLRQLWKTRFPIVNSVHHQAVSEWNFPAELRIAARSDDGIVEAFEIRDGSSIDNGSWFCAVQWHPEHLIADSDQLALFKELVASSASCLREQKFVEVG